MSNEISSTENKNDLLLENLRSSSKPELAIELNHKNVAELKIVAAMFREYIEESSKRDLNVQEAKLGFDFYDRCLMLWLEVDDEKTENQFLEIQGTLNKKYKETGFHISSTILSDWDGLPCPSNYKPYTP